MGQNKVKKKAFVFQGVGSNIEKTISVFDSAQINYFHELCEAVSDFSGINLTKYLYDMSCFEGTDKMFAEWILTGLSDCTVFHTCIQNDIVPDYIIGYSLGLNNAIYCSGSIHLEDTVHILSGVIRSIIESQKGKLTYDMGVIVGLDMQTVKEIINLYSSCKHVMIASENSEYCIVITGVCNEVQKVLGKAQSQGALKTRMLDVPCAFHSNMLIDCASYYYNNIENIHFNDSKIPVVSIYDQKILITGNEIYNEQRRNFLSSMKWKTTIEYLEKIGVNEFWDMSTNGSMKKSTVLTNPDSSFYTIKTLYKSLNV